MRHFVSVACATLIELFVLVGVASAAPYEWRVVGVDPCGANKACTAEWALSEATKAGLIPAAVEAKLAGGVKAHPAGGAITIKHGDHLQFMTWGAKGAPTFKTDVVAAWGAGREELAGAWAYTDPDTGVKYTLIRVVKCGNWGMLIEPPAVTAKPEMELGPPPPLCDCGKKIS